VENIYYLFEWYLKLSITFPSGILYTYYIVNRIWIFFCFFSVDVMNGMSTFMEKYTYGVLSGGKIYAKSTLYDGKKYLIFTSSLPYRKRRQQMTVFKDMGLPGPEPNFLFGNLLYFLRRVSTCIYLLSIV
jgi:hypothetical protein